jgi:hypothetical protein
MLDTTSSVVDFLQGIMPNEFMDYAGSYGEPGYSLPEGKTPMVVLGNFWCRCANYKDERWPDSPLHGIDVHYPAAFRKMEEQGVELVWSDEWMVDYHHDKAYRTTSDSYHWKPSVILTEDCEWMTPDDDLETWIDFLKNDPSRCLPDHIYSPHDLIMAGFDQWGDEKFESGWHPGQNDDPKEVLAEILRAYDEEDVEVVFVLDETSQFYLRFSAYYRTAQEREEALADA